MYYIHVFQKFPEMQTDRENKHINSCSSGKMHINTFDRTKPDTKKSIRTTKAC